MHTSIVKFSDLTILIKPLVIYDDVSRPKPMTVFWLKATQSITARPMKETLTGPVTVLNWSFINRDLELACKLPWPSWMKWKIWKRVRLRFRKSRLLAKISWSLLQSVEKFLPKNPLYARAVSHR